MSDNCLFCKIIRGEIPADKLYEDDDIVAFRDISPQAPIHFLIVPRRHISGPAAVDPDGERLAGKIIRMAGEIAGKEGIDQYRLVMNNGPVAGQTVFHLHLHVLGGRTMLWPPG